MDHKDSPPPSPLCPSAPLELPAQPLRSDLTQLLLPLAVLPGLAMASAHAPMALLLFGPLVLSTFVLVQRDRYRLDRCVVHIDGPALLLRHGERCLMGLDLRYAERHELESGEVLLSEGDGWLVLGVDPRERLPPGSVPEDGRSGGLLRPVRLRPADFVELKGALRRVAPQAPPSEDSPLMLLQALGSVGPWGPRAEALLRRHVHDGERPSGILSRLRDLALRPDRIGQAALRVIS